MRSAPEVVKPPERFSFVNAGCLQNSIEFHRGKGYNTYIQSGVCSALRFYITFYIKCKNQDGT